AGRTRLLRGARPPGPAQLGRADAPAGRFADAGDRRPAAKGVRRGPHPGRALYPAERARWADRRAPAGLGDRRPLPGPLLPARSAGDRDAASGRHQCAAARGGSAGVAPRRSPGGGRRLTRAAIRNLLILNDLAHGTERSDGGFGLAGSLAAVGARRHGRRALISALFPSAADGPSQGEVRANRAFWVALLRTCFLVLSYAQLAPSPWLSPEAPWWRSLPATAAGRQGRTRRWAPGPAPTWRTAAPAAVPQSCPGTPAAQGGL